MAAFKVTDDYVAFFAKDKRNGSLIMSGYCLRERGDNWAIALRHLRQAAIYLSPLTPVDAVDLTLATLDGRALDGKCGERDETELGEARTA
jgi:hypothetical protein